MYISHVHLDRRFYTCVNLGLVNTYVFGSLCCERDTGTRFNIRRKRAHGRKQLLHFCLQHQQSEELLQATATQCGSAYLAQRGPQLPSPASKQEKKMSKFEEPSSKAVACTGDIFWAALSGPSRRGST